MRKHFRFVTNFFFVKIAKNIHEVLLMMVEFQNCLKSIYLLNVMLENDKLF